MPKARKVKYLGRRVLGHRLWPHYEDCPTLRQSLAHSIYLTNISPCCGVDTEKVREKVGDDPGMEYLEQREIYL
jgi:hypothetical protein